MKIGVTGPQNRTDELKLKISSLAEVVEIKDNELDLLLSLELDAFIDLDFDDHTGRLPFYINYDKPVLLSAVKTQLAKELSGLAVQNHTVFGMNALPTF